MNPPYDKYTHEELVAENIELRRLQAEQSLKLQQFQFELEQLKRLVFGSKRERFIPAFGASAPSMLTPLMKIAV